MEILFLVIAFLMHGTANTETEVTGISGENIIITCSRDDRSDDIKYFCEKNCKYDDDVLIKSRGRRWYSKGRYSIIDDGKTFRVKISQLTKKDAGTYWCGWEQWIKDDYEKVVLTVREGTTKAPNKTTTNQTEQFRSSTPSSTKQDKPATNPTEQFRPSTPSSKPDRDSTDKPTTNPTEQFHQSTQSSMKPLYIGAILGVITLTLALVLLIYFKKQKRKISTYSEKAMDETPGYATVSGEKIKSSDALPSSTAQSQDTSKYSDSLISPDSLVYSTVSHSHMNSSQVSKQSPNVTYATILITNESESVYCNV
ncbi:CMRF35-like molecule 5 isoform X2 [Syngnathus acus]|uniref:CMRF35-like molecule 5 isoform X2 n=1 Tax=Syngnathus acus TaxID=161584 RepID=UPI001885E686|nr:CMRF35-like molecule 5 isoform X2 [Syngnathus acus]